MSKLRFKVWDPKYKELLGPFEMLDFLNGNYPSQFHLNNYPGELLAHDSCAGEAREDLEFILWEESV